MGTYLHLFETNNEFTEAYYGEDYHEPWVSATIENGEVKYNKGPEPPEPDPMPEYGYVDLGLPSRTLWATKNVGAATESDYGNYFAWGECFSKEFAARDIHVNTGTTIPANTYAYTWANYYYSGASNNPSKYNSTDRKTRLEGCDDGVFINMGSDWVMPTSAQCQELIDNTDSAITVTNGVSGLTLTSKINGKKIFFPGAGVYWVFQYSSGGDGAHLEFQQGGTNDGWGAYFWSSNLSSSPISGQNFALLTASSGYDAFKMDNAKRYDGISLRGVKATGTTPTSQIRYMGTSSIGTVEIELPGNGNVIGHVDQHRYYYLVYDENTNMVKRCGMQVLDDDNLLKANMNAFKEIYVSSGISEDDWYGFTTFQGSGWGNYLFIPMKMTPGIVSSTTYTSGSSSVTIEYQAMTNTYNGHTYYCLKKKTINGEDYVQYRNMYNRFSDSVEDLKVGTYGQQSADGGAEIFHMVNPVRYYI